MSVLDDIKNLADENGKVALDKLGELKDKLPTDQFDKLQKLADRNDDGKVNLADLEDFDFGSVVDDVKDKLGGMFGGK